VEDVKGFANVADHLLMRKTLYRRHIGCLKMLLNDGEPLTRNYDGSGEGKFSFGIILPITGGARAILGDLGYSGMGISIKIICSSN
jgi:hypothetical protein